MPPRALRCLGLLVVLALPLTHCGGTVKVLGPPSERLVAPSTGILLDTQGELRAGDAQTTTGGFADQYEIQVAAGQRLSIACLSNSLDSVLVVQPPGGTPLSNDDYQGDRTRSQVDLLSQSSGPLKITVTTYAPGAQGGYRIVVLAGDTQAPAIPATPAGQAPTAVAQQTWPLLMVPSNSQGTLAQGDAALPTGQLVDNYLLAGGNNQAVEIAVQGTGVGPMLVVMRPSGQPVQAAANAGGRASVVVPLGEPGAFRVQVVSSAPGPGGAYSISVTPATASAQVTVPVSTSHQLATLAPTSGAATLSWDGATQARLDASGGTLQSGEFVRRFTLNGNVGEPATFDLQSSDFDPFLIVIAPSGRQWSNDDANGGRDSQLAVVLPEAGAYQILATAYRPGMQGNFVLKVRRGLLAGAAPADSATATASAGPPQGLVPIGPGRVPSIAGPQGPQTVSVGGRVERNGALAPGDSTLRSGELYDTHTFTWSPGQTVRVRLSSTAFDSYVIVRAPSGQQQDNDDQVQGQNDAGLDYTVRENGLHSIIVTSYRANEQGAYTLTVDGAGGGGQAAPPPAINPVPAVGNVVRGALQASDSADANGRRMDRHQVNLARGEAVRFELTSGEFDTLLRVQPPNGAPAENDDAAQGNTNSALDVQAQVAGAYAVTVSSYRPGEMGNYELRVIRGGAGPGPQPTQITTIPIGPPGPPTPPVRPGTPVQAPPANAGPGVFSGSLAQGDQQLRSGEFVDNFNIQGTSGETVHLRLTSSAFDPYLILKSPSGHQEDNDDINPQTRDAGLDLTLSETGTFTVMVTSYRAGEQGAYTLNVTRGAGGPGPGVPPTTGPIVGPPSAGGGRVFGIFAGISDYANQNDLPECANDARKLAEDLRRVGLMTEGQQVLLTDSQATTQNIRQAFATLAPQVGPNDVFIFFYSGHGGQRPSQADPNELDRRDETIVLYDQEMLDDEMANLFNQIHGRIGMIALDSCFSGGFAKDVIRVAGRMGMFSSEEDLTSSVAGQFQAGGYLSHFLRTGIDGEADMAPRDGTLTAGELSHYLFRQFGAHVGDVGATDQNFARSFQHLVIDRGAVGVADLLFNYPRNGG